MGAYTVPTKGQRIASHKNNKINIYKCEPTLYPLGSKNTGQFIGCNGSSIQVSKYYLVRKYRSSIIFKTILFSFWVPISEERKTNLRKPYLRILVRIAESLYSGGSAPVSGSASAYVRLGSASISVSGFESTILPISLN
jgi:hypothetical protein